MLYTDGNTTGSCTEKNTTVNAVTAGGVGAALFLIIVIEFIVILVWIYRRLVPIHQHTQLV